MSSVSRRAARAYLPACAASIAAGGPATGSEANPILSLYGEWQALRQDGQRTETEKELDRVVAEMTENETRIFAQPSRTPRDLAVKIAISQDPSDWENEQPLWQEIRQLVEGV